MHISKNKFRKYLKAVGLWEVGLDVKMGSKMRGMYANPACIEKAIEYFKNADLLGTLQTPPVPEANKENNMNTSTAIVAAAPSYSIERDRIGHFVNVRLPRIASEKTEELAKHFGITDDAHPKTFKELLERIEKKHYIIDENREELAEAHPEWCSGNPLYNVRFRDPKVVADAKGYSKALKEMHDAMRSTEDELVAHQDNGEKMLEALAKFEGKTFH